MAKQPATELDRIVGQLRELSCAPTDFDKVTQLELLQQIANAAHGAMARVSVEFDDSQRADQALRQVPSRQRGRGVADQIALARRISPYQASRDLGMARALRDDLPGTGALLSAGRISERTAQAVHHETDHLARADRQQVDSELSPAITDATTAGAARAARAAAFAIDPDSATKRATKAAGERGVSFRAAKDGMARLGGYLPGIQGVAAHRALRKDAKAIIAFGDGSGRTLQQVMADLLVERLTGQPRACAVPVEVQLVMTEEQLFGETPDSPEPRDPDGPSWVDGYGPVPAAFARAAVAGVADALGPTPPEVDRAQAWLRRVFTDPCSGQLVDVDTNRRRFDGTVRRFIRLRDQFCRIPFCDAPIEDHDHIARHSDGGATSIDNGMGICRRFNLVKEMPGWHTEVIHAAGPPGSHPHTVVITTPTGKTYRSTSPPVPGARTKRPDLGVIDLYFTTRLAQAS